MAKHNSPQAWIRSASFDISFISGPAFISVAIVLICAHVIDIHQEVSSFQWLLLVLGVDVSHVYSTIYRTYADPQIFKEKKSLLLYTPLLVWLLGVILYSLGYMFFWRAITYLAVFHFVRQQYGFMKIYTRKESLSLFQSRLNALVIYATTIYPLLVWHLRGSSNITWFVQGDFLMLKAAWLIPYISIAYLGLLLFYCFIQFRGYKQTGFVNMPKNIFMLSSALSWYFAIVYFDSDFAFTLINVISHGVPYIALIWVYGNKEIQSQPITTQIKTFIFSSKGLIVFVGFLLLLSFIEESLWDVFVWRDHPVFFEVFYFLPHFNDKLILCFIVPLLSVPQLTHYVLDGFIWRRKDIKA